MRNVCPGSERPWSGGTSMPGRCGHVLCHVLKAQDSCKLLPKHAVTGGQEDGQVKGNVGQGGVRRGLEHCGKCVGEAY